MRLIRVRVDMRSVCVTQTSVTSTILTQAADHQNPDAGGSSLSPLHASGPGGTGSSPTGTVAREVGFGWAPVSTPLEDPGPRFLTPSVEPATAFLWADTISLSG